MQDEAEKRRRVGSGAVDVWPEHHATWETWLCLANQWRIEIGMKGLIYLGINFPSIGEALDMADVPPEQRRAVRQNLRCMENEALPILNGATGS